MTLSIRLAPRYVVLYVDIIFVETTAAVTAFDSCVTGLVVWSYSRLGRDSQK